MFKRLRSQSIVLAALLQVLPICRTVVTSPTAASTFAIILRWVVGATAATEAFDAVSGASAVVFTTPTNFSGTVGVYFTNYVSLTNNGSDPGAFFVLTNKTGISSAISNNTTTTVCMPPGLTFKCIDASGTGNRRISGAMFGTPTAAVTNNWIHFLAGFQNLVPAQTNIWITISPAAAASPPVITNQPVGVTNVAGTLASISVVAGGTAPLTYQWFLFGSNSLPGATNTIYNFGNLHLNQSGDYTVQISNSVNTITSSVATVWVTPPPSPTVVLAGAQGNFFEFTFTAVPGLTNIVETNGSLPGSWVSLTNIPPPGVPTSVTITDAISGAARFYRVEINP